MSEPIISEKLLQYIWLHKYYNKDLLTTIHGDRVTVTYCGEWNTSNEGPDFKNAKITVGNTQWFGHIELHIKSSQWKLHKHDSNKHYENVILHVVYEHDEKNTCSTIPIVELKDLITVSLLYKYEFLMQQQVKIPCAYAFSNVASITKTMWQEKMIVARLMQKTEKILTQLSLYKNHWEEIFWHEIAKNFGLSVNASSFEMIAQSIDITIIYKLKNSQIGLEALLLGQAGLLEQKLHDEHALLLQREYKYLQSKWKLFPIKAPISFLRMRPANFPTLRLSQLAQLIYVSQHLFSIIRETDTILKVQKLFDVKAHDYWDTHYQFDEATPQKEKWLGKAMIDTICINTIIPFLYAWGIYYKDESLKQKAIDWLNNINAEKNSITNMWQTLDWKANNASESQAQIFMYKEYCKEKRCLTCSIGNAILKG